MVVRKGIIWVAQVPLAPLLMGAVLACLTLLLGESRVQNPSAEEVEV